MGKPRYSKTLDVCHCLWMLDIQYLPPSSLYESFCILPNGPDLSALTFSLVTKTRWHVDSCTNGNKPCCNTSDCRG